MRQDSTLEIAQHPADTGVIAARVTNLIAERDFWRIINHNLGNMGRFCHNIRQFQRVSIDPYPATTRIETSTCRSTPLILSIDPYPATTRIETLFDEIDLAVKLSIDPYPATTRIETGELRIRHRPVKYRPLSRDDAD